jgi:hypothetical protein
VLSIHLETATDGGTRTAEIRGARPELLAALSAPSGSTGHFTTGDAHE